MILIKFNFKILIIALLIALFYGSTLTNGFVHDDIWQVQSNKHITSFKYLPKIFTTCIAQDLLGGCKGVGFYWRPLQYIAYLFSYQISTQPWFFHLINLVYFFIAAVLVFQLFKSIYTSGVYMVISSTRGVELAFIGTILFLIHPINSEVINWVSATPELLMTAFFLITVITFIIFIQTKKKRYLLLSCGSFFLSLLSKETALFLLPLLPIYLHLLSHPGGEKNAVTPRGWILESWKIFIPFLLAVGLYLAAREEVLGRVLYKYEGYYSLSFGEQILNAIALYPKYLMKLIYPHPLSFQAQFNPITTINIQVLLGLLAGFSTFILIVIAYIKKYRLLLFGIFLIILPILPSMLFINKLGENVFSERYLFFSSIGVALIVTDLLRYISIKPKKADFKKYQYFFIGTLILYLISSWWVVFQRNKDWKDNISSYQAMIRIDPSHKNAYFHLGQIYQSKGEIKTAKDHFQKALIADPNYQEAKLASQNISNYYSKDGISFYYHQDLRLEESGARIIISSADHRFKLEIKPNADLNSRQEHGQLINQGNALISNFDQAYLKVWNDNGVQIFQFLLNKGAKSLEILIFPANSSLMKQVDAILGTIKIN